MSEASDGPSPPVGDDRRGDDSDDSVLELVATSNPEVVREHLVAFLLPPQTSDLLSTSRLLSKLSASVWKTMLANLSGASGGHGTEGNGGSQVEGEVEENESTLVLKDRFRLEYYMEKHYFEQSFRAFSSPVKAVQTMAESTFVTAHAATGELKLWNATNGVCIRTFDGKGTSTARLACVDKNRLLCMPGPFQTSPQIELFDVQTGQRTRTVCMPSAHCFRDVVSLTPETAVTIDASGYFEVWHNPSGTCVCKVKSELSPCFTFRVYRLSRGSFVGACNAGFDIRDAKTGNCIRLVKFTGGQDRTTFTKTKKMLLCLREDGTVNAWDLHDTALATSFTLPFLPNMSPECTVAPGGSSLVLSCSEDRKHIHAWDSENGRLLHTFDSSGNAVYSLVRLNPAAFITVHASNNSIKIWKIPRTCFRERTKRKAHTAGDLHVKRQARGDDELGLT